MDQFGFIIICLIVEHRVDSPWAVFPRRGATWRIVVGTGLHSSVVPRTVGGSITTMTAVWEGTEWFAAGGQKRRGGGAGRKLSIRAL